MKILASVIVFSLSMSAPQVVNAEEFPPCIPLNEALSVCTDVQGVAVSFVDGTPVAAMGIARLQRFKDVRVIWAAYWDNSAPLDVYAHEQAQAAMDFEPGYRLQKPVPVVAEGFSGVQFDLVPKENGTQGKWPRSMLFLDTGAGKAILNTFALSPKVTLEDIHLAAKSAARIFQISE